MTATVSFQIVCHPTEHPSEAQMQQWIDAAVPASQTISLNVRLVDEAEMQELNKQYRKKDKVTDIISFPFEPPTGIESEFIGDIVLCPSRINEDASQQQKPIQHHWAHLLIHGTLHLLGFDHHIDDDAEKMMTRELEILHAFNIPNPYEI